MLLNKNLFAEDLFRHIVYAVVLQLASATKIVLVLIKAVSRLQLNRLNFNISNELD